MDGFITAASLKHFGMDNVTSSLNVNTIPEAVRKGSDLVKRQWLHNEVSSMLDKYVMNSVSHLEDIHNELAAPQDSRHEHPYRFSTCTKKIKYVKCLLRHEKKVSSMLDKYVMNSI